MAVAALLVLFLKPSLLLLLFQFCNATDTITPTRFIKDGETLVSNGETFALGFFSPGNSPNRYVGIWYNKVPERTVVWVANRDNPIINSSGVLKIDHHGIPSIFNGNSSLPIWSSSSITLKNSSTTTSSPTLKLLDSGNLVLIQEDTGIILWQSFDYPTDTFLPGMKLGSSPKTGLNWSLTSWKSPEDPGRGEFTYSLDRAELPVLFLRRGRELVWRSGHWNGRAWSGLPEMTRPFIFNNSFVNNPDESYVNYTMHNSSILSRLYLDDSGHVLRSTWVEGGHGWNIFWYAPKDSCDNYGECGTFGSCNPNNNALVCSCLPGFGPKSPRDWYMRDGAQGCVREREVGCGNGDGFLKMERLKPPDTSNSRVNMSLGLKDCEMECRKNCSCTGFATADVNGQGSGCLAWFGDLTDIREYADGGQDLYVRVDAITLAENANRKSKGFSTKKKMVILSVAIAVGVLTLISAMYWSLKKTKRRGLVKKERIQRLLFNVSNLESRQSSPCAKHLEETNNASFDLPIFDLDTIMAATQNFSPSNKLGSGGFGSVYRGRLIDGREIAVKRLSKSSRQGVNEFKNEILLIAKLQHRNLVQILGCCIEEEEKMLIYEYMPNKSLDFFLFDRARSELLDWRLRYEIILGIARGVLYLHQDSRLRIIHRDLKASNILLDAEMTPKISDFGMARIFGGDQIQANTNRVVGTYGYMSPEYAMDGIFSIKSDVFSFGVLLLEIISGTKNSGYYHVDPSLNLLKHAWELWRDGRALELVDPSMADSYPEQEVLRCIQVGILCVQEKAKDRPTMSSVVFMLGNETSIPSIKQPAFVLTRYSSGPDSSTTGTGSCSVNEISTTVVEGR